MKVCLRHVTEQVDNQIEQLEVVYVYPLSDRPVYTILDLIMFVSG
jgi:hypothetical protein